MPRSVRSVKSYDMKHYQLTQRTVGVSTIPLSPAIAISRLCRRWRRHRWEKLQIRFVSFLRSSSVRPRTDARTHARINTHTRTHTHTHARTRVCYSFGHQLLYLCPAATLTRFAVARSCSESCRRYAKRQPSPRKIAGTFSLAFALPNRPSSIMDAPPASRRHMAAERRVRRRRLLGLTAAGCGDCMSVRRTQTVP